MITSALKERVALMIDLENTMDHDKLFEIRDEQDVGHENVWFFLTHLRKWLEDNGFAVDLKWCRFYLERRPYLETRHPGWHQRRELAAQAARFRLYWSHRDQPAEELLGCHLLTLKAKQSTASNDVALPTTVLLGSGDGDLVPDVDRARFRGNSWHRSSLSVFVLRRPGTSSRFLEIVCDDTIDIPEVMRQCYH